MALSSVILTKIRKLLSSQPVEKAWLFGSFARGEERPNSDVDIMVTYSPGERLGLFGVTSLKLKLEEIIGRKVDLVERGRLFYRVEKEAERQKIVIYEK